MYAYEQSTFKCITKVQAIFVAFSSFVNAPHAPIFLDLIFLFKWLKIELKGMFHNMLAFFKGYVPPWESIISSNVSYVHMFLLLNLGNWFSYVVMCIIHDLGTGDTF